MPTNRQLNDIVDTWLGSTNDSPQCAPLTVARVMKPEDAPEALVAAGFEAT